jgi:hypothetical protein
MAVSEDLKNEIEQNYDLIQKANEQMMELWLEHVLFSWRWWLGGFLTISPWLFWLKVRKRESSGRLLFAGMVVVLIVSWLDFVGIAFGLWHYISEVLPFIPAFIPWDFSMIPVLAMLILQTEKFSNPFVKAAIFACISSFIAEPLFEAIGLYEQETWRNLYSFPIYFAIYLAAHYLSKKIFSPLNH